jgi:Fur family peroxide stress response transcriptional regulator
MKNLTRHRKLILENLKNRLDHPTAKMVYDSVRETTEKFSFATVYNSLEYLVSQGFIKKLDIDSGSARYDGMLENHMHFICKKCGEVFDLPQPELSSCLSANQEFFYETKDVSITIRGICKNCNSL